MNYFTDFNIEVIVRLEKDFFTSGKEYWQTLIVRKYSSYKYSPKKGFRSSIIKKTKKIDHNIYTGWSSILSTLKLKIPKGFTVESYWEHILDSLGKSVEKQKIN
jgi:hypothetical protein